MSFNKLEVNDFTSFFRLMEISFPASERRDFKRAKALFESHNSYHVIAKKEGDDVIAFLAYWIFGSHYFIDHLAVDEHHRGEKLGSRIVDYFLKDVNKTVVLEVEPLTDEITQKRVLFYKRLGFHLNPFPYTQPPMQRGEPPVDMIIMSYPDPLDEDKFRLITEKIIQECYPPVINE